jgi:CMP-N-acetylneuraminic acid synthetase
MSNICYIQARAGSKRFPKKSLALWKGKPMVADAIEKAQATGLFDYIAVSSDDPDVLQIAVDYGVLPLWRSPATASDTATDDDVAAEVLRYFPKALHVCKMYPCIPLLTKDHIDIACDVFDGTSAINDGVYFTDKDGKDSGTIYIFRVSAWLRESSIALDKFNWGKMKLNDEECQDINTPDDLEKAKLKAGI